MDRSNVLAVAALVAVLLLVPGALAEPRFQTSGGYKAGQPLTRSVDACGLAGQPTQGVDSSCASLPEGLAGLPYNFAATNDLGSAVEIEVCFYHDRAYMGCGADIIPAGANAFSVSSIAGLNVEWTFVVA